MDEIETPAALPVNGGAQATGYLLITASENPREPGKIIPDTPENRARFGDGARPATAFEIGVAGFIMTRGN